jgi:hypothetical protein
MSGLYSIQDYSAQHYDEVCARHKPLPFLSPLNIISRTKQNPDLGNTYIKQYNLVCV